MSDSQSNATSLPGLLTWLESLLLAACDLYAAGLILYFVLRLLSLDPRGMVAIFSNFLHWALLLACLLLPFAIWRKRWVTVALLGPSLIAFVWLFGGLFLPASIDSAAYAESPRRLTVMTHNVNAGNATPERLIPFLRESGADIIGLQEVSPSQLSALEEELGNLYPYRVLRGYGIPGIGLLSRYPIVAYEVVEGQTIFPYLAATLDVEGKTLTVIVVHPAPPGLYRGSYVSQAVRDIPLFVELATNGGPTLMLGDFNAVDQSTDYALITRSGLHDAFREVGWGFGATWPARRVLPIPVPPLVRIDYIWHTDHFEARRAWVGPRTGSDHLPVLAELIWQ